jgi:hypothetical protein
VADSVEYPLERLYADQDYDWVVDSIPAVLAWVPGDVESDREPPFLFNVAYAPDAKRRPRSVTLALGWDLKKLTERDPDVLVKARRYRSGRTVHREHLAETAAYGLAFVAISVFLPGRRVVWMQHNVAPDIVLDRTPGALRGVEVAGRGSGGFTALRAARVGTASAEGKAAQLRKLPDVAEAYLSLWCQSPRVAEMYKVKP